MTDPFASQVSKIKPLFDYLNKQRENQKFVKTTEITATFILISFFLFFAVRPTFLTISSLVGEIKSKELMKKELKVKINNVILAQDLFSQAQERYQVIDSSLPDKPGFFDAANQTIKTGQNADIAVSRLNINLLDKNDKLIDPNLNTYTIGLNIDGQFSNAVKAVGDLLNNRRVINIESFGISKQTVSSNQASPSATTTSGGITTSFTASFYYWPENYGKK
jgi:hypothetical protein